MINILIVSFTVSMFIIYIFELKKKPLTTKELVIVGVMSAAAFILHNIQFIKYPQGGGITLFSMLPIMLLSIIYGTRVGIAGGIVLGILELLIGGYVVHPVQILLDYIMANFFIGTAGILGNDNKKKILVGSTAAVFLGLMMCIFSGVVFFGEYAPKGMNVWVYSILYNGTSMGVEGIITIILLAFLPIKKMKRIAIQ